MRTTMNMRERIRWEMDRQSLTAKELARRAKLNETYVRDLMEGRSQDPKLSKILALAEALGKDLSWLVEGIETSEIADILRRLPAGAKAEVIDFARFKQRQSGGDS